MNDQSDISYINQNLYQLKLPDEPMHTLMFYFKILNSVIDYPFPANYLNYDAPHFKTYNEVKQFMSLADALNPEVLHLNNVLIYYNNKNYYKSEQNVKNYEFKIIDPNESNASNFKKNYINTFNINNIDHKQKEFLVTIKKDLKYPHSESSDYSSDEKYYYEDGFEENYENNENPYINENKDEIKQNYSDYRNKYNQKIIKNHQTLNQNLYENQMEISDHIEEEEELNEIIQSTDIIEKVNIINKLVCSKEWIDTIYYKPMKKAMRNLKSILEVDDVIRTKNVSMPKNIFFYLLILVVLIIIACACFLIYSTVTLDANQKFLQLNDPINKSVSEKIDYNNDTVIVPCHSCYRKILKGNHMGMVSGIFSLNFVIFVFAIYLFVVSGQAKKCKNKCKKNNKTKNKKKKKIKLFNGFNMIYLIVFIFLILIAIIFCLTAEVLIIIGLGEQTYEFIHQESRNQLIVNSIILVSYFLFFYFYFKQ